MHRPFVKLFGERNCGTRAMQEMMRRSGLVRLRVPLGEKPEKNPDRADLSEAISSHYEDAWRKHYMDALRDHDSFAAFPLGAWKHAAAKWHDDYSKHRIHVLFMTRSPYSWAVSMARRPYHVAGPRTPDFATFLCRPWLTQRRDNCDPLLASVIDLWNVKNRSYLAFRDKAREEGLSTALVRFEEFIAAPDAVVRDVQRNWGLDAGYVRPAQASTKDTGQNLSDIQEYYRTESWRKYHTKQTIELISELVDWDVANALNYEMLDADAFPDVLPDTVQKQFSKEMMSLVAAKARINQAEDGALSEGAVLRAGTQ